MENYPVKIIVEQNVPFLEELDKVADVVRLPAEAIDAEAVRDVEALVVRTRTRCDESLLAGSRVRFIGSATIGTDHIDLPWCASHGIAVANAPGCNAPAVAQYVFSSLMRLINRPISSYRIGIVGVGHVGSIVERWARGLGMSVLLCDPPRQRAEGGSQWCTLGDLAARADIITFHTPLTLDGDDATYHLAGEDFFRSLRRVPVLINSARGAVADNAVWADAAAAGVCGAAVVDCWENEPDINSRLLGAAAVATPHIAGYSAEGKRRASQMVADSLCAFFGLPQIRIHGEQPSVGAATISAVEALRSFDPMPLTAALKADPASFERLRDTYALRHEPSESFDH